MSAAGIPQQALDPAVALLRAALRREVDADQRAKISQAARTPLDLEHLVNWLEGHGIARLVLERLDHAGVDIPPRLRERDRALQDWSDRTSATVAETVRALHGADVPVVLLKGASLSLDAWPNPTLRQSGDVDLLVHPRDVRRARSALEDLGFGLSSSQFPAWWYRFVHFHLKLRWPGDLLSEVELHWHLHSPALMFGVRLRDLWRRSQPVLIHGIAARTLDPLDRFLHLATHLLSHWHPLPRERGDHLLRTLLEQPHTRGRPKLKWLMDLVLEADRLSETMEVDALRERAREWAATRELSTVAELVRDSGLSSKPGTAWLASLAAMDRPAATSTDTPDRPPAHRPPHPALDFRIEALARWPAWFLPSPQRLRERLRLRSGPMGTAMAVGALPLHAVLVLAHTALAIALIIPAIIGRTISGPARRRAAKAARTPERVLDLTLALRRARSDAHESLATTRDPA